MSEFMGDNKAIVTNQSLASCSDTLLTVGCQRNISAASVAAIEGPLCLAVADKKDTGSSHFV
jgi:hypothetical protein